MASQNKSAAAHRRRDAARQVAEKGALHTSLPVVGTVTLPQPQSLAWYAGIGVLAACGIIEWPVAGVVAVGKLLADNRHSKALEEFGDALDQAG